MNSKLTHHKVLVTLTKYVRNYHRRLKFPMYHSTPFLTLCFNTKTTDVVNHQIRYTLFMIIKAVLRKWKSICNYDHIRIKVNINFATRNCILSAIVEIKDLKQVILTPLVVLVFNFHGILEKNSYISYLLRL